jgi:hypothetical protein
MAIEIEEFEINKKPQLLTVIGANIRFWIWVAMHSPGFQGKSIKFGFRKPLIEIHERIRNDYYVSWEITRNLNPKFGVKVPMIIISAYERATNADTSFIWK